MDNRLICKFYRLQNLGNGFGALSGRNKFGNIFFKPNAACSIGEQCENRWDPNKEQPSMTLQITIYSVKKGSQSKMFETQS